MTNEEKLKLAAAFMMKGVPENRANCAAEVQTLYLAFVKGITTNINKEVAATLTVAACILDMKNREL